MDAALEALVDSEFRSCVLDHVSLIYRGYVYWLSTRRRQKQHTVNEGTCGNLSAISNHLNTRLCPRTTYLMSSIAALRCLSWVKILDEKPLTRGL